MKKIVTESGQAIVLVLLSLAVVLTIVLFVLARSVTDIAVSSRSEEAVRAFSAAEAGIENALVIGLGATSGIGCDSTGSNCSANFVSNVTGFAEGSGSFDYPPQLLSGDSMTTWFVAHLDNGSLGCDANNPCFNGTQMNVCWGESGTSQSSSTTPAIEVSVFYETTPGNPATVNIKRVTADPYGGRSVSNGFGGITGVNCPITGSSYAFNKTIVFGSTGLNIPSGSRPLFARIRMFYNTTLTHPVGISVSGGLLPSQGQDIISTGSAGDANRKVAVFQGWPEPPAVFDFAIYSGTGLTK
jgi:Tfp pilus assembly protein PilX